MRGPGSSFASLFLLDLAASVLTFLLYGWDKGAAKRRGRRVPEKTLHVVALLGGWPGAALAQTVFHHKTQKRAFRRVFWATIGLNVVITAAALRLL